MSGDETMRLRGATAADAEAISALVSSLLHALLADPDDVAAAEPFLATVTPDAIRGYVTGGEFRYHVVEIDGQIRGAVAIRDASHLYHLFVDERFHRRGIARRLWEAASAAARDAGNPGRFTVNSSLVARPVYESFGFVADGEEVRKDGVAFVPMTLDTCGADSGTAT